MSDTAWRKQILKAAPILVEWVLQQQGITKVDSTGETVLEYPDAYAIDATDLPVQDGNATSRRMHTIFSICEHCCVHTEVTDRHGGESLTRFSLHQDALYFADRAYGRTPQIACAMEQKAHKEKRTRRKATLGQRKISAETVIYSQWIFLATTLPYTCPDTEIVRGLPFTVANPNCVSSE